MKREGLIDKLKNKFSNIERGVLATAEKTALDTGWGYLISLCRDTVHVCLCCVCCVFFFNHCPNM